QVWKKTLFTLKSSNPTIRNRHPTAPDFAAGCIGRFWNSARPLNTCGLHRRTAINPRTRRMHDSRTRLVLIAPTVIALWFLNSYAAPYFTVEQDHFGIYWARHDWLYVHIIAGMAALLLGPLQLWLGLNRK